MRAKKKFSFDSDLVERIIRVLEKYQFSQGCSADDWDDYNNDDVIDLLKEVRVQIGK